MRVKTIDEKAAKEALKSCPQIVQDYVAALERSVAGWQTINKLAVAQIKKLSKEQ